MDKKPAEGTVAGMSMGQRHHYTPVTPQVNGERRGPEMKEGHRQDWRCPSLSGGAVLAFLLVARRLARGDAGR